MGSKKNQPWLLYGVGGTVTILVLIGAIAVFLDFIRYMKMRSI